MEERIIRKNFWKKIAVVALMAAMVMTLLAGCGDGGSESENFNTMIGTGDYPEIIDMSVATDSPQTMYENGILMDITQYVEDYMPNYRAFLDKNPELKPFVQFRTRMGTCIIMRFTICGTVSSTRGRVTATAGTGS